MQDGELDLFILARISGPSCSSSRSSDTRPLQAPWITQAVKNFLRKKHREEWPARRQARRYTERISEGARLVEEAKRNFFFKAGKTLANPGTSSNTYWSLINTILNKAKILMIPHLLENVLFVTDFAEKAQIFNEYLILQCTFIDTGSKIPQETPLNTTMISDFVISDEKILNIIRSLNPN